MKVAELIKKIEKMRGGFAETEQNLMDYRNRTNGSLTVAEIEARAGFHVCGSIISFIEDLAFQQEIEQ